MKYLRFANKARGNGRFSKVSKSIETIPAGTSSGRWFGVVSISINHSYRSQF